MIRKTLIIITMAFLLLSPLAAMSGEEVNAENLTALLSDAGYESYIDEDGDTAFKDQYGMEYWIICGYPEENCLYIQSGWSASPETVSETAFKLANEGNRTMFTARCYYEPMERAFYADYTLRYSDAGIDDAALLSTVEAFLSDSDVFTDFLIGEGAM